MVEESKCTSTSYKIEGAPEFKILLLHIPGSVLSGPSDDNLGRLVWLRDMVYKTLESSEFTPKLALAVPGTPSEASTQVRNVFGATHESMRIRLVSWTNIKELEESGYRKLAIRSFLQSWIGFDPTTPR
jgi:hypothetical protein